MTGFRSEEAETLPPIIEEACRDIGIHTIHSWTGARNAAWQIVRSFRRLTGEFPDSIYYQRRIAARLRWLASGPIPDLARTTDSILWLMESCGNGARALRDWLAAAPDVEDAEVPS